MSEHNTNAKSGAGNKETGQPQHTPQSAPVPTTPPAAYERPNPTVMPGLPEPRYDGHDEAPSREGKS